MEESVRYASPESQYEGRGDVPGDTEEMFWLRMQDDYASRLKLGNLLVRQYRYREAVEAYRKAERIRRDDPMLYLRLGGACLTLFRFEEAMEAYRRTLALGMEEKETAFYFGVWHYLAGEYGAAAEDFEIVLPCGDETAVSAIYWHTLASVRCGRTPSLLSCIRPDMKVGHHKAYLLSAGLFRGNLPPEPLQEEAQSGTDDLHAAILGYALAVRYEANGDPILAERLRGEVLARESVWPCVASLAARRDRIGKNRR